ncbi:MAG: flagellar biosynthetic protein FliO [Chthonomonadaceae bacterium]|nr:flagellar biosynthetic protein FliO [Chthonomonadaceae bacterium]
MVKHCARVIGLWFVICAAHVAIAQSLGTKKDIATSKPTASGPIVQPMDLIQMVVALAVVGFLVKWLVPKAVAFFGKRITTPIGSTIRLEESATFGGGQLQVVTVRGKALLLSVSSGGVSFLADLTEEAPVNDPPLFMDVLDQADPTNAIVSEEPEEEEMSISEAIAMIQAAKEKSQSQSVDDKLDRLNRLMGGP